MMTVRPPTAQEVNNYVLSSAQNMTRAADKITELRRKIQALKSEKAILSAQIQHLKQGPTQEAFENVQKQLEEALRKIDSQAQEILQLKNHSRIGEI